MIVWSRMSRMSRMSRILGAIGMIGVIAVVHAIDVRFPPLKRYDIVANAFAWIHPVTSYNESLFRVGKFNTAYVYSSVYDPEFIYPQTHWGFISYVWQLPHSVNHQSSLWKYMDIVHVHDGYRPYQRYDEHPEPISLGDLALTGGDNFYPFLFLGWKNQTFFWTIDWKDGKTVFHAIYLDHYIVGRYHHIIDD